MSELPFNQASIIPVKTWTQIVFNKNMNVDNSQIVPTRGANLTKTTLEFLGDSVGKPIRQLVPDFMLTTGQAPVTIQFDISDNFNEIVTREDGTKISLFDLIDLKGQEAEPKPQV